MDRPDYQLKLPLNLEAEEEEAPTGFVSPDEARLRSETARKAFERNEQLPYAGEYLRLREYGWDWRVAAFIVWASSPQPRTPKTQFELATQFLGLTSDRTISKWKKNNPQIEEMIGVMQAAPLFEYRAEIYQALIESAIKPEYKGHNDRKLALELMGDYVSRSKLEAELNQRVVGELGSLSFDEKLKLAGLDTAEKIAQFRAEVAGKGTSTALSAKDDEG
jgi:hypothetical protein